MSSSNTGIKSRLRTAYLTTTVSISLVLLVVGCIVFLGLNARRLSEYVKENIGITIYIKDKSKQADIIKLQKILDVKPYVKSTELVSKDKAAQILKQDLGEDFVNFLGKNPLSASINVHFYADYATTDSLAQIQKKLMEYKVVKKVSYQKDLLGLIENNIRKISFVLFFFASLLFVVSYALISNTIRLSIYSQRFIIRTMKLVGATRSFIRNPFLINSIKLGLVSSIIALTILSFLIYLGKGEFEDLIFINDTNLMLILYLGIIGFGIVISYLATFFSVNKYLRLREQELYY